MSNRTDSDTSDSGLRGDWQAERAMQRGVDPDDLSRELTTRRTRRLAEEILKDQDEARRRAALPLGVTLGVELANGVPPIPYTIERLHPSGSNTLLAAQYKTGKTSLCLNLGLSLADDVPFLGSFPVDPWLGRVGIWNYEMSQAQFVAWAAHLGLKHPDSLVVAHLRGQGLSLLTRRGQDEAVRWLEHWEVQFWIIDPFRRAFRGVSSNDNDEVDRFLEALDIIKERAGVPDLLLSAHTGRMQHAEGEERARGATALDDWADARWILTRDKGAGTGRYLRAEGRDVMVEEQRLTFDPETLRLTLGGEGRAAGQQRESLRVVATEVADLPGIGKKMLETAIKGHKEDRASRIADAVRAGLIEVRPAPRNGQAHHLTARGERFLKSGLLDEA